MGTGMAQSPWARASGKLSPYLTSRTFDPCVGCLHHCARDGGDCGWGFTMERPGVGVHIDLGDGVGTGDLWM